MSNKDLRQLKPIYIHEASYSTYDEISLVNLVAILVKRKALFSIIFIGILSSGIAFAILSPRIYTSSVTIEIGSQIINDKITPFESPNALLAKLEHNYVHEAVSAYRRTDPDVYEKYNISISVPNDSNVVVLEMKGTEQDSARLTNLLKSISDIAIQDHNHVYNAIKNNLETRLSRAESNLGLLQKTDNNEAETLQQTNLIESLNTQLTNLRRTRTVTEPFRSIEPTGISRKTIAIVSLAAGIAIGILGVFFAEFWLKVRKKLSE